MPMRRIAVANQKGGVAKSTTALNVGAALAKDGQRVLLLDLDPHAGLTFSLGFNEPEQAFEKTAYDLLDPDRQLSLVDVAVHTQISGVDLVPAHQDLVEIDYKLVTRAGWSQILKRLVQDAARSYDVVIIDTPPSLGILTRMAVVAAELVIVPVQAEWMALRGLRLLNRVVEQTKADTNHRRLVVRYLLTMAGRTRHAQEIEAELRQHFGNQVFTAVIPRSIRFADSSAAGKPLLLVDHDHHGAVAYLELTKEINAYDHPNNGSRSRQLSARR